MAVYGNSVLNMQQNYNPISFTEFYDFVMESNYEVELIFEKFNIYSSILENNDIEDNDKSTNTETAKKTIIEKIKELFKKLKDAIVGLFYKLVDSIEELYKKVNLQDKVISQFSNLVTFENLQKAKEKGWKGIPENIPMINRLCKVSDSQFFDLNNDSESRKLYYNMENLNNEIIRAKDLDEAQSKYNSFKELLKKFKKSKSEENAAQYIRDNEIKEDFSNIKRMLGHDIPLDTFFCVATEKNKIEDKVYYFPIREPFETTKTLAETGQRKIKDIRSKTRKYIRQQKIDEKEAYFSDMKLYKNNGSNALQDANMNKINMLYLKSKYELSSAYCQRQATIVKSLLKVISIQHNVAINFYMRCLSACKKYAK